MILFLHNGYRTPGGEEQAVENLIGLVRNELGEPAQLLSRDSMDVNAGRAAIGLLRGGLGPAEVGEAVRRSGARIIHAHNLLPTFGWRSLAAARAAGARVVLHLHQYRLVCAIGVCFRDGHECTECHGARTGPAVRHDCRGSRAQSFTYAASLALWQRRLVSQADVIVVPSTFAASRLRELGAPIPTPMVVPNVIIEPPPGDGAHTREGALVVSRLAPEKGVDIAIEACAHAAVRLTVAGDGPDRKSLEARAARGGGDVRFLGRVGATELARLRVEASVAVVASRSAETFGLAAGEAMAAGLPVAASRIGALPELVPGPWLAPPGDARALAAVIARLAEDPVAGERARMIVRERAAPAVVARSLRAAYDAAMA